FLTVICFVLSAFSGAFFANLCAEIAQLHGVLFTRHSIGTSHKGGSHTAKVGTVAIEPDARNHIFYIVFLQTFGSAMIAGGGTGITGVYAAFEFLMTHNNLILKVCSDQCQNY